MTAAYALFVANECNGITSLRGGSAFDLARVVRLLLGHPTPLAQYPAVMGWACIRAAICPLVAVPTTAGTGSEVGTSAVIITADGRKLGLLPPDNLPTTALCNPELTAGLPPGFTAGACSCV